VELGISYCPDPSNIRLGLQFSASFATAEKKKFYNIDPWLQLDILFISTPSQFIKNFFDVDRK
jgi:hypothetical protein